MKYRTLGKTGLEISILGQGGFHLLEISLADAQAILHRYLDAGGNYIETAAEYGDGESERKIGTVMTTRRDECILATKCHAREKTEASKFIAHSLKNLQTDHVDILFMHHVQTQDELDRILADKNRSAEELRQRGIVAGTANEIVDQLGHFAEGGIYRIMLQWIDLDDLDGLEAMAKGILPQIL